MKRPARSWFWKIPVEQEIDEEIAFHLDMHTRDLIASGMPAKAAREKALQRLGDLYRLRRTCVSLGRKRNRMMRITQCLGDVRDDVIVAIRRLKQAPGFTARGHPHARARHRRQQRHLRAGRRDAAAAVALSRP